MLLWLGGLFQSRAQLFDYGDVLPGRHNWKLLPVKNACCRISHVKNHSMTETIAVAPTEA